MFSCLRRNRFSAANAEDERWARQNKVRRSTRTLRILPINFATRARLDIHERIARSWDWRPFDRSLNDVFADDNRGMTITDEYVDVGISGAKDRRPELDRLMVDARRRRFDAVLVARFDRFARSTK